MRHPEKALSVVSAIIGTVSVITVPALAPVQASAQSLVDDLLVLSGQSALMCLAIPLPQCSLNSPHMSPPLGFDLGSLLLCKQSLLELPGHDLLIP